MIKTVKSLLVKYREIIMYLIFGVITTAVNWAVYAVCVRLMSIDLSAFSADGVIMMLLDGSIDFKTFMSNNGKELSALFIANILAWVAGVIVAFVTNKIWVFQSRDKSAKGIFKELSLFVSSRLITGVIEWFGLPLVIIAGLNQTLFGIEGFPAKIIISVIVVILNYVFSKLIIFKKKKGTIKNDV